MKQAIKQLLLKFIHNTEESFYDTYFCILLKASYTYKKNKGHDAILNSTWLHLDMWIYHVKEGYLDLVSLLWFKYFVCSLRNNDGYFLCSMVLLLYTRMCTVMKILSLIPEIILLILDCLREKYSDNICIFHIFLLLS